MKILFLCHKMPYPANDGGAIATLSMINGFARAGDTVSVLAMQTHKHPFPVYSLPAYLTANISWSQVWVNTKLNPVKAINNLCFSKEPYNAVRFQSKEYTRKLTDILLINDFDIIQLEGLYLCTYIDTIRKYSQAKNTFRAHNVEYQIWQRQASVESNFFKKQYFKILARRVKSMELTSITKIDLLIPITVRDAEVLNHAYRAKVWVAATGIEESKFKFSAPKYNKSLFYIGALDWRPNQEGLVWFLSKVWQPLHDKFPGWKFYIAGRNAPLNFVKELNKHAVTYVGEVENSTQFIDDYNIMVVPLLAGSGMRIKIIEGMARGKCILTTSIGAEGIPAENGKDIFIQDTPNQFKLNLKNLFQNQDQIEKCGENAFIFVQQNFNNATIIDGLRGFYNKHTSNT